MIIIPDLRHWLLRWLKWKTLIMLCLGGRLILSSWQGLVVFICSLSCRVTRALIRLHRIYNFWLFHANITNFHILLETFYNIFGTNILIQCPVPVPVCCMFFVSEKTHTKRPNGIKPTEIYFGIFMNFGKWNHREIVSEGARGRGARPRGSGAPWALMATP